MKFTSPILEIDEEANHELIESSISALKEEPYSFAILEDGDIGFVQALITEHGVVVQFQIKSIDQHYELNEYLSKLEAISLFQEYLAKLPN